MGVENTCVAINIGNLHTLAFYLHEGCVKGLFEHHTARLNTGKLEVLVGKLMDGTLSHQEVFEEQPLA